MPAQSAPHPAHTTPPGAPRPLPPGLPTCLCDPCTTAHTRTKGRTPQRRATHRDANGIHYCPYCAMTAAAS